MQRFFVEIPLTEKMFVRDERICGQLFRVLRMRYGDEIILFNGEGKDVLYTLSSISAKEALLVQKSVTLTHTEPPFHLTLCQALPNKWEKIEWIVQKWVEIGVSRFIFFRSDRSQVLPISPNKIARVQTIAIEALEQCGGSKPPVIEFMAQSPTDIFTREFVLSPTSTHLLVAEAKNSKPSGTVALWVGPEGGWSDGELQTFEQNKKHAVSIGSRILRTETAGLVGAFALLSSSL